jgi:hypothetical protein
MTETAFVLVTDLNYFWRAQVTINDLRNIGNWKGELILITIDFNINEHYKKNNGIIEVKFPEINKTYLLNQIGSNGFNNSDKRELNKLNQWEKLHVFDDYFSKWERIVFLDAGLRVLDDVKYILELDYKNKILAPIDGKQLIVDPNIIFKYQLDHDNLEKINIIKNDFGENIFEQTHMLNCMWIYDTSILKVCNKEQLIEAMNKYPVCRTNEMGIMNLMFHFKYKLWEKLPAYASNGKYLFEWSETNNNFYTTWQNYCFLKYPITIGLNQIPL